MVSVGEKMMNPHAEIHAVIDTYCSSIFKGNVERLRTTFHPGAILSGEVKGQPYYKTLDEYLDVVGSRQSPHALGEVFEMKVLSLEIVGAIAFAKVSCPMFGYNYVDLLSFVRHEGRWGIAAKIFTHMN